MPRFSSIYQSAKHQRALRTPETIKPQLVVWVTPRDQSLVVLDESRQAREVRDLSPYKTPYVQTTSGSRPTHVSTGPLRGIACAGSDTDFMTRDVGYAVTLSDMTVFIAAMITGNATSQYPSFISASTTSASDDYGTGFNIDRQSHHATNPVQSYGCASPKDATNADLLTDTIAYNDPFVMAISMRDSNNNLTITLNGKLQSASRTPSNGTANMGFRHSRLFVRFYGGSIKAYERGVIGEIVIVNKKMNVSEIDKMLGYLAWANGVQNKLSATSRFRNRPWLIGD